jgi:hypothetical protein
MKIFTYRVAVFLLLVGLVTIAVGCHEKPTYSKVMSERTSILMSEAVKQTGLPNIHNFWQRKQLKMILEMVDDSTLLTYAYSFDRNKGMFRYIGRAVGFGVPFAAQYTNPQQIATRRRYGHLVSGVIAQPDPSGIYSPTSATATWLLLVDSTGDFHVVYMEPLLTVSQVPLPGRVVEGGYPSDFWEKESKRRHLTQEQVSVGLSKLKRGVR